MKKRFCILTLLLACIVSAQAQWFSLGVKGGYSTTLEHDQSYQEVFDIKSNLRNGFHLGLYMRMGRTWYVQPEALFNYYSCSSSANYENENIFTNKKYQINTKKLIIIKIRRNRGIEWKISCKFVVRNSLGFLNCQRNEIKLQKCIIYNIDFNNFWFGENMPSRRDTSQ